MVRRTGTGASRPAAELRRTRARQEIGAHKPAVKEGRALDQTPQIKVPETPAIRPSDATLGAFKLALARLDLRMIDAQKNARSALASTALQETSPEIETDAAALVRACLEGGPSPDLVQQAAQRAMQASGVSGLAQLTDVVVQRHRAVANDLEGDPRLQPFRQAASELEGALAEVCFAQLRDHRPADAHQAMQRLLAINQALSPRSKSTTALLQADRSYTRNFYPFTNERGWPAAAAALDLKGSAAIGCSGALLDAASRGAGLCISVDTNPAMQDFFVAVSAILLAVDERGDAQGWDPVRRAQEVEQRLLQGDDSDGCARVQAEWRQLGVPEDLVAHAPDMLSTTTYVLKQMKSSGVWCSGPDAAAQVAHLTKLAREGGLIAVTADFADPTLTDRVNALLQASGTRAGELHLSNALDYIPDIRGTIAGLESIDRTDDAVLSTSSVMPGLDKEELGTFDAPRIRPAADWFGDQGLGAVQHERAWSTPNHRRQLWELTNIYYQGQYTSDSSVEAPESFEDFRQRSQELLSQIFSDPESARARLRIYLERFVGCWYDLQDAAGKKALEQIELPVPRDLDDLPLQAARFEASFWNDKRRAAMISGRLRGRGLSIDMIPGSEERISRCRSTRELRDLASALRDEAEQSFGTWTQAQKSRAVDNFLAHANKTRDGTWQIDPAKRQACIDEAKDLRELERLVDRCMQKVAR